MTITTLGGTKPRATLMRRAASAIAPLATSLAADIDFTTGIRSPYAPDDALAKVTLDDWFGGPGGLDFITVDTARALSVAVIAKTVFVLGNTGGRLPFRTTRQGLTVPNLSILDQPERGIPRATTLRKTIEELFFRPAAYWIVTERDARGWPAWVERANWGQLTHDTTGRLTHWKGQPVNPADVLRFDSPLGAGFLSNAAETIRRGLVLNHVASLAEDNPVPTLILRDISGNQLDPTEVKQLREQWIAARKTKGPAFIPKTMEAQALGVMPEQLLIEGRRAIQLETVRHAGVSAWLADVTVEGSTLKYENRELRNWELLDLNLMPYITALTGRLSMADVTPRGWEVTMDADSLTRPDQKTRFETYKVGKDAGFITAEWIAIQEGWPLPAAPELEGPA